MIISRRKQIRQLKGQVERITSQSAYDRLWLATALDEILRLKARIVELEPAATGKV